MQDYFINTTELENLILGSLIVSKDVLWTRDKLQMLKVEYFHSVNQQIFKAVEAINGKQLTATPKNLKVHKIEYPEISEMVKNASGAANCLESIQLLKEAWVKNEFLKLAMTTSQHILGSFTPLEDIEKYIGTLRSYQDIISLSRPSSMSDVIQRTCDIVVSKRKDNDLVSYCMPKIRDEVHIFRKQVHVIGADSGIGKTAICLSFIQHQYNAGVNSVYFCCESTSDELFHRLCCQSATCSYMNFIKGFPYGREEPFKQAIMDFGKYPERITLIGKDNYKNSIESIDYTLWNLSQAQRIDMVYIDYLQNTSIGGRFGKQYEMYEAVINAIGDLAVKYNCAITVISQLNREREADSVPRMQNLRGASAIENVAHIISFLYMDKEVKKDTERRIKPVCFYSDKTRLIKSFNIKLKYDSYCGFFHDEFEDVRFPWQTK